MSRFDLLFLAISLIGLVAVAGAGLLFMRLGLPVDWAGLPGVLLAALMIAAAAVIAQYVAVSLARQRLRQGSADTLAGPGDPGNRIIVWRFHRLHRPVAPPWQRRHL